jgi:hypothetical protein
MDIKPVIAINFNTITKWCSQQYSIDRRGSTTFKVHCTYIKYGSCFEFGFFSLKFETKEVVLINLFLHTYSRVQVKIERNIEFKMANLLTLFFLTIIFL